MGAIPDVPGEVKVQIIRENELEKEILFQDDDATKNSDMLDNNESSKDNPSNAGQEHNLRYRGHGNTVTPL